MATLYVKDVPDDLYKALQARAKANGRSLSAEVRIILRLACSPESQTVGRESKHFTPPAD